MNDNTNTIGRGITLLAGSVALAAGIVTASTVEAAVPGIAGPSFVLQAHEGYISQPDGAPIYAWGYGCDAAMTPSFLPTPAGAGPSPQCGAMQLPGPTLIVHEGETVTVKLKNALPLAAGATSINFPGFDVTVAATDSGQAGRLVAEAPAGGGSVTYTFVATKPGTYAYYSGSQPELQVEMGMFGALIVLPNDSATPVCPAAGPYSLARSAYDDVNSKNPSCYQREYLMQFSELSSTIHQQVKEQVDACAASGATSCPEIEASLEPYRPNYYLVNGRSMPDLMDTSYSVSYPNQPYNGNPHLHPGELMLMRIIGQGRWQHPFHFHANHARVIARDANPLLTDEGDPAGPLLFTTATVSGQTVDQIFTWTGKNLGWDIYNHKAGDGSACTPDANGYHSVKTDPNYGEWCADHGKPIPATPPDPNITAIGQWYGGTPYLGLTGEGATAGTTEPPGTLNQNPEAGLAYMWHSHNEREITTNDVFPGGMLMMLLIDPPSWIIDETL
jgi:FtsP/CotA-like multicopper oxidase with cupredoxin domain